MAASTAKEIDKLRKGIKATLLLKGLRAAAGAGGKVGAGESKAAAGFGGSSGGGASSAANGSGSGDQDDSQEDINVFHERVCFAAIGALRFSVGIMRLLSAPSYLRLESSAAKGLDVSQVDLEPPVQFSSDFNRNKYATLTTGHLADLALVRVLLVVVFLFPLRWQGGSCIW